MFEVAGLGRNFAMIKGRVGKISQVPCYRSGGGLMVGVEG